MAITVDSTTLTLPPLYDEYLDKLIAANSKEGNLLTRADIVQNILVGTYDAHLRNHPASRPDEIAAQITALELQANEVFKHATSTKSN